jgi:hypothetical protein
MPKRYAKGKFAVGECARSGRKMLLKDMVSDGYYPSLVVDPAWYEGKHPQESLPEIEDPVALWRPAPERDQVNSTFRPDRGLLFFGFALGSPTLDAVSLPPPVIPSSTHEYNMDATSSPEPDTGTG